MYSTTVRLQLDVAMLGKALTHEVAMSRPMLRQTRPDLILARRTGSLAMRLSDWEAWCASTRGSGSRMLRTVPPLHRHRLQIRERIRQRALETAHTASPTDPATGRVMCKRPASTLTVLRSRARGRPVKRTAYTRQRVGSLVPASLRVPRRRFRLIRKTKVA